MSEHAEGEREREEVVCGVTNGHEILMSACLPAWQLNNHVSNEGRKEHYKRERGRRACQKIRVITYTIDYYGNSYDAEFG